MKARVFLIFGIAFTFGAASNVLAQSAFESVHAHFGSTSSNTAADVPAEASQPKRTVEIPSEAFEKIGLGEESAAEAEVVEVEQDEWTAHFAPMPEKKKPAAPKPIKLTKPIKPSEPAEAAKQEQIIKHIEEVIATALRSRVRREPGQLQRGRLARELKPQAKPADKAKKTKKAKRKYDELYRSIRKIHRKKEERPRS